MALIQPSLATHFLFQMTFIMILLSMSCGLLERQEEETKILTKQGIDLVPTLYPLACVRPHYKSNFMLLDQYHNTSQRKLTKHSYVLSGEYLKKQIALSEIHVCSFN